MFADVCVLFFMLRRPPRSTRTDTRLPSRRSSDLAGGGGDERMRLVSLVENLDVVRAEPPAKVIVNARTGTVVINGAVRVGTVAVTQGKLPESIKESPTAVQHAPFRRGRTAHEPSRGNAATEANRPPILMKHPDHPADHAAPH